MVERPCTRRNSGNIAVWYLYKKIPAQTYILALNFTKEINEATIK
jgi:hypothetical protein